VTILPVVDIEAFPYTLICIKEVSRDDPKKSPWERGDEEVRSYSTLRTVYRSDRIFIYISIE
jgi:hypothetical protein